jgi:hydroxymethylpyrimidine pyrophosphatase-like HAD family hydrolase
VDIVLATGRSPWYGVGDLVRDLGLTGPQITMQGALIVAADATDVLRMRPLRPRAAPLYREALAFARLHGLDPVVAVLDGHRAERRRAAGDDFVAPVVETHFALLEDLAPAESESPLRVYLPTPIERHAALLDVACERFARRASIIWSNDSGFEILAPGTTKGDAIAWLAAARRIGMEQVAAVGDANNDLEMLRVAGRSAAMGSAPAAVRAAAGIVVPTSAELGVLHAFAWFLPELAPALLEGASRAPIDAFEGAVA